MQSSAIFARAWKRSTGHSLIPCCRCPDESRRFWFSCSSSQPFSRAWGYNTTTLLAGLGIGGVALALASQKTIENLFGSVAVISDRPVSVGDFCKFGSSMGTVEDIGLRSTRIRTLDRTLVTVPNGSFSTMTLENFDRRDKTLFHVTLEPPAKHHARSDADAASSPSPNS